MAANESSAEAHQEQHQPSAIDLFSVDPGLVLWTWITFFILFWILKKFAWKPLFKSVEERENFLANAVNDARETKAVLEGAAQKEQEIVQKAKDDSLQIIREGKEKANQSAAEISNNAKKAAEKIISDAEAQIKADTTKASEQIKKEAVTMIIQTTSQVIRKSLDQEEHHRIIREELEAL